MLSMYHGIPFSPYTELTQDITATDTTIYIANANYLPSPPNIAVIGRKPTTAETIIYTGKTENAITGCTRAVEGNARAWTAGTLIARNYTNKDHENFIANIEELEKGKAKKYLQEDGWNDKTAITSEMLPSQFPFGLSIHRIYRNAGFPGTYGNVISIRNNGTDTSQLFLEWTEYNKITGNVYYRSARDTYNKFGSWKQIDFKGEEYTFTTSELVLTSEWQDTGVVFTDSSGGLNLPTGTYIMQATFSNGKAFWSVIMSGIVAVLNGTTNSNNLYEIPMSQSNHSANGRLVKFATCSQSGNSITSRVKLQVKCEGASEPNPVIITFKFRRMI